MKTFFEFLEMMEQENQGATAPKSGESELEKKWKAIASTPKAKNDPKEFKPRREKGFDPDRLDPGLRDLVNDEVNHRVHEFAKIVANLSSAEKITSWVGRHNTKLPYNMEIAGEKVAITAEMLKKESEDYLSIGDKFMGPASDKGTLDFASLLFGKMGRDQEAFADILGTGDPEYSKILRTDGKQDFSYTSFHPDLKDKAVDIPLANAFDTGALDKAIIMTIYLRNRGKDEQGSERRWRGAFKWISKNVFAKIRAKQKKSLDAEMGDTGKTLASQVPDFRKSTGGTTKFNRAVQLGSMVIELKNIIKTKLPEILSSSPREALAMIGQRKTINIRINDIAYKAICKKLSTPEEKKKWEEEEEERKKKSLPKSEAAEKEDVRNSSGLPFLVNLFDKTANKILSLEDRLLKVINEELASPINARLATVGEPPYKPSSLANLGKLFVALVEMAEDNMAQEAEKEGYTDEKWGFITQRMRDLQAKELRDLTIPKTVAGFTKGTESKPPVPAFWKTWWQQREGQ